MKTATTTGNSTTPLRQRVSSMSPTPKTRQVKSPAVNNRGDSTTKNDFDLPMNELQSRTGAVKQSIQLDQQNNELLAKSDTDKLHRPNAIMTSSGTNILANDITLSVDMLQESQNFIINSPDSPTSPTRLTRTRTYSTTRCEPILAAIVVALCYMFVFTVSLLARGALPDIRMAMDTPRTEFSADRAMVHLSQLTQRRHPWNTVANHDVGLYIASQLERIQKMYPQSIDFTVDDPSLSESAQLTAPVNVSAIRYFASKNLATGVVIESRNIVARLRGSQKPRKSLLLSAHYDSAATSFGAFDDGLFVAAMIEMLESMAERQKNGQVFEKDVTFLFGDGEESGLLDAYAFTKHPFFPNVSGFINMGNTK